MVWFSYDVSNNSILIGKTFLCLGEITENVGKVASGAKRVIMDVGDGQLVIIDYFGTANLKEGTKYKIFSDVAGLEDGKPVLNGWFAYLAE